MIDDSPNAGGEKFVAAKYSTGKVLILRNLSNLTVHLIDTHRKFIGYFSIKDLHRMYICILFIVLLFLVWCRNRNKCHVILCHYLLVIQEDAIFKSCDIACKISKF